MVAATLTALVPDTSAQTIRGRLLDLGTGRPVDLGLVIMLTEAGDSVTSAVTSRDGLFSLTSAEPGSFVLLASAWGYREAREGVFDLGEDGEMTVDFRVRPEPLPIDEILVGVDRPVFDHKLVRNGFVRRFQRGLGHFITPYDIERSPARETEALFAQVPGMVVARAERRAFPNGDAFLAPLGDGVWMRNPNGNTCAPAVFIDGIRANYDHLAGLSLSTIAPLASVEAVEVYRRPAEVPVEYGVTQGQRSVLSGGGTCGVLVFWTKSGLAPGQAPSGGFRAEPMAGGAPAGRPLPAVARRGPPPTPGERIRMELDLSVAGAFGLTSPWEGTFVGVREGDLIASDASSGRPVAVPRSAINVLHVERARGPAHAVRRGAIIGSIFGAGTWASLRLLCEPRCRRTSDAVVPATALGLLVGLLVAGQGPGTHWVGAPLPDAHDGSGTWGVDASRRPRARR